MLRDIPQCIAIHVVQNTVSSRKSSYAVYMQSIMNSEEDVVVWEKPTYFLCYTLRKCNISLI